MKIGDTVYHLDLVENYLGRRRVYNIKKGIIISIDDHYAVVQTRKFWFFNSINIFSLHGLYVSPLDLITEHIKLLREFPSSCASFQFIYEN